MKIHIDPINTLNFKKIVTSIKNITVDNKIPKLFNGQSVFIVGGGSSLSSFNFSLLKGYNIIAINTAIKYIPFAQVLYFSDKSFYEKFYEIINSYSGYKFSISKIENDAVIKLNSTGKSGLDTNYNCIRNGNNSGYAAINLAYHMGARKIILLGYDGGYLNKKTHFHSDYKNECYSCIDYQKVYNDFFIPYFNLLPSILKKLNIEIYNASINSKIEYFKKIKLDEIFNYYK